MAVAIVENPFYATKFGRAGIDAATVRTAEDFARLPGLSGGPSKPTARPAPEPAGHAGDSRQMDLF